jgi:hypothetical protein
MVNETLAPPLLRGDAAADTLSFSYDPTVLAIPVGLLLRIGIADGFRRGELAARLRHKAICRISVLRNPAQHRQLGDRRRPDHAATQA